MPSPDVRISALMLTLVALTAGPTAASADAPAPAGRISIALSPAVDADLAAAADGLPLRTIVESVGVRVTGNWPGELIYYGARLRDGHMWSAFTQYRSLPYTDGLAPLGFSRPFLEKDVPAEHLVTQDAIRYSDGDLSADGYKPDRNLDMGELFPDADFTSHDQLYLVVVPKDTSDGSKGSAILIRLPRDAPAR
jgi:hypothetical protein